MFALLQFPMTLMVGYRRAATEIPFLDGGDVALLHRLRAHGSFTETVPMVLLAMVLTFIPLPGFGGWTFFKGIA